jgi:hypothetical protein
MKTLVYPLFAAAVLWLLIIAAACGTARPKPGPAGFTDLVTAQLAARIDGNPKTRQLWLGRAASYLDNAESEPPLTPAQRAAYFLASDLEVAYPKIKANWLQLGTWFITELQRERAIR